MHYYLNKIKTKQLVHFFKQEIPKKVKKAALYSYNKKTDTILMIFELDDNSFAIGEFSPYSAKISAAEKYDEEFHISVLLSKATVKWQDYLFEIIDNKECYNYDLGKYYRDHPDNTEYNPYNL